MLTRGTYLLDTCICIALIKEEPAVVEHIRRAGGSNIAQAAHDGGDGRRYRRAKMAKRGFFARFP